MKALATAVIATALLAGCGGSVGAEDETWSRTNAVAEGLTEDNSVSRGNNSHENLYLDIILSEYPNVVAVMGSEWIIDFGHNTCDAISDGSDWQTIQGWIDDPSLYDEISYMVAAAVTIFCPENEGLLFG